MEVTKDSGPILIGTNTPLSEITKHLADHGCPDITSKIDPNQCDRCHFDQGGYGDVYLGKLSDGTNIVLKYLRIYANGSKSSQKNLKRAARELHAWSTFHHENVLPLFGLAIVEGRLAMVSPFMKNGKLPEYIDRHPNVDRCLLCMQVVDGVAYLHSLGNVHGDLKGANILIADDGTAKLADFGNAILATYEVGFTATDTKSGHSENWAPPEILMGAPCSMSADVYSLGMTIVEIFTGAEPYCGKNPNVISSLICQGILPQRPKEIPEKSKHGNSFWTSLAKCCSKDPESRPKAAEVRVQISHITKEGLEEFDE